MPDQFVDYYELMQISPKAEPATVARVFKMLAARYHPDNTETGDMSLFIRLNEAYKTLSDPESRAKYDSEWRSRRKQPINVFAKREFAGGFESESNKRMGVLTLLYNKRRTDPVTPGMSVLELERTMTFPREHLEFTLWYLKDKSLITQNDTSDLEITSLGVDYVEQHVPSHESLYKLLKAAEEGSAKNAEPPPWPKGYKPPADS